jgi:hypothetical protein
MVIISALFLLICFYRLALADEFSEKIERMNIELTQKLQREPILIRLQGNKSSGETSNITNVINNYYNNTSNIANTYITYTSEIINNFITNNYYTDNGNNGNHNGQNK